MSYIEKREVFFVLELDILRMRKFSKYIKEQFENQSNAPRAYVYDSDFNQAVVGGEISEALRFSTADLAIKYLNRNEAVRSIRPLARLERTVRVVRQRVRSKKASV